MFVVVVVAIDALLNKNVELKKYLKEINFRGRRGFWLKMPKFAHGKNGRIHKNFREIPKLFFVIKNVYIVFKKSKYF